MVEKKIEEMLVGRFQTALSAAGVDDIQVVGVWSPAATDAVKGLQDGDAAGIVAVKVYPRQYETFTIPDGNIQVDVSLVMRAEVDSDGTDYLKVSDALASSMHVWQRDFSAYYAMFRVPTKFEPTGFRLDGGDCGMDREAATWTYTQSFVLQGIIF